MTKIQWTDETWNPLRGCSRVSKGCVNCYAEKVAKRFCGPGQPYEGLVRLDAIGAPRAVWNGTIRQVPEKLDQPLRWTKPRMVFVNSMSDLFHEAVPFEYIAAIFGVMAASPQHTFQVLTKRPARAAKFFAWAASLPTASGNEWRDGAPVVGYLGEHASRLTKGRCNVWLHGELAPWPLPNVWLGVSVEDQATADERIPALLRLPAAVRWVSYEPALGPVSFTRVVRNFRDGTRSTTIDTLRPDFGNALDWIVVGGESGPGARPFDIAWARQTIEQCARAGVPVFMKQLGSNAKAGQAGRYPTADTKGGDMSEWPAELRVRQYPSA